MGMTGRKCGTCKHYEPAPIWRKGWCRNPMLFSPQQSHLVSEEELDCERGMGNYWDPIDASSRSTIGSGLFPLTIYPAPSPAIINERSMSGLPVYSVSGSSGYTTDDPDDDSPPQDGGPRITTPGGRDRNLTYYAEERYWTDYLRIAAPILGVLLFLILLYFWASSFLGDDNNTGSGNVANSTSTSTLPIIGASPTASVQTGATGEPQIILTAPPGGVTPVVPAPTETPPVVIEGGVIYAGAVVSVANTGVEGVNMRSEATTSAAVVTVLIDGTQLTTTGEAVESEGLIWWPVEGESGAGWIAADFLTLVQ